MQISIDGESFTFSDDSTVKVDGYDLKVEEPGFDKSTEEKIGHFTSKPIILPPSISGRIKRTGLLPCSKVFRDAKGKQRLYTYFD